MKKQNKTVENTAFLPEAELKITGYEFALLNVAMEQMFEDKRMPAYPIRYKYTDQEGEPVEEWTVEQLQSGEVLQVMDIFKTFNPKNAVDAYCGNISMTMMEALRTKFNVHEREIKKAVSIDDFVKEMDKRESTKLETLTTNE